MYQVILLRLVWVEIRILICFDLLENPSRSGHSSARRARGHLSGALLKAVAERAPPISCSTHLWDDSASTPRPRANILAHITVCFVSRRIETCASQWWLACAAQFERLSDVPQQTGCYIWPPRLCASWAANQGPRSIYFWPPVG